jgi:hypothetical protein
MTNQPQHVRNHQKTVDIDGRVFAAELTLEPQWSIRQVLTADTDQKIKRIEGYSSLFILHPSSFSLPLDFESYNLKGRRIDSSIGSSD